jgi:hypothetical protein
MLGVTTMDKKVSAVWRFRIGWKAHHEGGATRLNSGGLRLHLFSRCTLESGRPGREVRDVRYPGFWGGLTFFWIIRAQGEEHISSAACREPPVSGLHRPPTDALKVGNHKPMRGMGSGSTTKPFSLHCTPPKILKVAVRPCQRLSSKSNKPLRHRCTAFRTLRQPSCISMSLFCWLNP